MLYFEGRGVLRENAEIYSRFHCWWHKIIAHIILQGSICLILNKEKLSTFSRISFLLANERWREKRMKQHRTGSTTENTLSGIWVKDGVLYSSCLSHDLPERSLEARTLLCKLKQVSLSSVCRLVGTHTA